MGSNSEVNGMEQLKELVHHKCSMKQDVYGSTLEGFNMVKVAMREIIEELSAALCHLDKRLAIEYREQGSFESVATIGGDTVVCHMHSNVFTFPITHMIHKSPFVKRSPDAAYFGSINIYNFLSDSFRYHRLNDSGYLIGRIFVDKDGHFFVEGKGQLAYKFNDISVQKIAHEQIRSVLQTALFYVLNFDLYTPPYQAVQEISLMEVMELNNNMKMRTAKRLGFKFESEQDIW
jgi:hypothetical protein